TLRVFGSARRRERASDFLTRCSGKANTAGRHATDNRGADGAKASSALLIFRRAPPPESPRLSLGARRRGCRGVDYRLSRSLRRSRSTRWASRAFCSHSLAAVGFL